MYNVLNPYTIVRNVTVQVMANYTLLILDVLEMLTPSKNINWP